MALLNNPASDNVATSGGENIYTADKNLMAPQKVSNRPVEAVPPAAPVKFDYDEATKQAAFAKSMATTGSVSGDSLVSNQLNKVLASGSPLLSRARTDANASSAERGLNNSSIGVQAGEEAMIRSAMPIAQQDAQTYANQEIENQRSSNQFGVAGLNQSYNVFNQNNQNKFVAGENTLDRTQRKELQDDSQNFTSGENVLDRTQRKDLQADSQSFTSGENKLIRDQQVALQADSQKFSSGENKTERDFRASEQDRLNTFNTQRDVTAQQNNLENIKAQTDGQIKIAASQLGEKTKGAYLEAASSLQKSFIDQQTAILNNPGLKTDAQMTNALGVAKTNFESSVSYLQGLYAQGGVKIDTNSFPAAPTVGPVAPSASTAIPVSDAVKSTFMWGDH